MGVHQPFLAERRTGSSFPSSLQEFLPRRKMCEVSRDTAFFQHHLFEYFIFVATKFRVQHFAFSGFAAKHFRGFVLIRDGYDTSYPSPWYAQGFRSRVFPA